MTAPLEAALLEAHARDDKPALVTLYMQAARNAAASEEARAFYLTQAYVFALDIGDARANALREQLAGLGREDAPW